MGRMEVDAGLSWPGAEVVPSLHNRIGLGILLSLRGGARRKIPDLARLLTARSVPLLTYQVHRLRSAGLLDLETSSQEHLCVLSNRCRVMVYGTSMQIEFIGTDGAVHRLAIPRTALIASGSAVAEDPDPAEEAV